MAVVNDRITIILQIRFMLDTISLLQAGISPDNLRIALEPEAASIYCQYLHTEKHLGADADIVASPVGTTYMVVDLGGKL